MAPHRDVSFCEREPPRIRIVFLRERPVGIGELEKASVRFRRSLKGKYRVVWRVVARRRRQERRPGHVPEIARRTWVEGRCTAGGTADKHEPHDDPGHSGARSQVGSFLRGMMKKTHAGPFRGESMLLASCRWRWYLGATGETTR